jgi:hypothetical protein
MLAVAMIGTALAAPAHAQPASISATSTKGEMPELLVAAFILPPDSASSFGMRSLRG